MRFRSTHREDVDLIPESAKKLNRDIMSQLKQNRKHYRDKSDQFQRFHSFQPIIDPISVFLSKKHRNRQETPVWLHLYKDNEKIQEKRTRDFKETSL